MLKVKLAFENKVMTNIKYGHKKKTCKIQALVLLLFKKLNWIIFSKFSALKEKERLKRLLFSQLEVW